MVKKLIKCIFGQTYENSGKFTTAPQKFGPQVHLCISATVDLTDAASIPFYWSGGAFDIEAAWPSRDRRFKYQPLNLGCFANMCALSRALDNCGPDK